MGRGQERRWIAHVLLGVFGLLASGCIGAAGVPGGPLQGTSVSLGGSYGYALSRARVTLRSTTDGRRSSFHDSAGDAENFPVFPSRIGGRLGLTDWFDFAADGGWLDSGLELRAGLPEGARPFPFAISVGVRQGNWGLLETSNRGSNEERLRLEVYPRLAEWRDMRLNLVATAGASNGRFYHPMIAPARYQYADSGEDGWPGPTFDPGIIRDEVRVEASAGVEVRRKKVYASLILMPYAVVHTGASSGGCNICDGWDYAGYSSNFGAALFLSLGGTFTFSLGD